MALASAAFARRTSIKVVLMGELKQAPRRPSSPMFNNRLTVGIGGILRPLDRAGQAEKCWKDRGLGRCCNKDTVPKLFSAALAAVTFNGAVPSHSRPLAEQNGAKTRAGESIT